jgi:hypothetical protein
MGNVAPRRRLMGGVNVYTTPQKNILRNSLQTPNEAAPNMTEVKGRSMSQFSNTKSGANLYRKGGILPSIGGGTMQAS